MPAVNLPGVLLLDQIVTAKKSNNCPSFVPYKEEN